MNSKYDAIVVGGGVIGGSIAYSLSKRGFKVLVLEKNRLASESSGAAGGMLAAQSEFNGSSEWFEFALKSREMFPTLAVEIKEASGIDIELINKGMFKVGLNEREQQENKQLMAIQRQYGEQANWLTSNEVRKKEPALSEAITGALFYEKDGQVDASKLSLGFLKSAETRGAVVKEDVEVHDFHFLSGKVTGVVTTAGDFFSETIVVAGGAWSEKLLSTTGLQLGTYPVKGECFSVVTDQPLLRSTIFSHGCYLVPKKEGRLIVGATVKPQLDNKKVSIEGIFSLMEKAKVLLPTIENAEFERAWAGIRPQTADGLPYVGEHPMYKGLFIATGHFRNGILLSPMTGEVIADMVEGKPTTLNMTSFEVDRLMKALT